ncbi:hypothetical protein JCM17844_27010 [Iodidimonas gelatinilytica]|uniref:Uncharacterized protein n=1 Tax=Iodidimonas gelatinilytica TaxID=1236966 RepID=A0A5A7MXE4_9PROT|nr:hypothetical protein [Iodidimonas gelatinilytica]GEQ99064.1 hypothetical protein JCM17844_27010 [Iodidimonas gelatinilytica]GER00751.1 hypothetical protein JCM17845_13740 [Iodidimonas gelatinilytica]
MISQDEADKTLRDIDRTMGRTSRGLGYRAGAPHLMIWGVIWCLGYGLSFFSPDLGWHWLVLLGLGILGSTMAGIRYAPKRMTHHGPSTASYHLAGRYLASAVLGIGFFTALFAILPPLNSYQLGSIFPLVVAALYGGIGIWSGQVKLGLTGLAVGLLTLFGYFMVPNGFELVLALGGGGALLLGGLWMRRW